MSTAETGDTAVVREAVDQAKQLLAEASASEEQLDLLEGVSPEEMAEAREALGPRAGRLAVLREARERRRGRPAGARNRRTDDFARYIRQFGQDPAVTMMQIQASDPEVLMQQSRRTVTKVLKGRKDEADRLVEVEEETLDYAGAQSLRIRCAEGLMPYLHGKKPVAIDLSFSGIADLMIEGVTHTRDELDVIEGDYLPVDDGGGE